MSITMSRSSIICVLLVMLISSSHGTTVPEAALNLAMNIMPKIKPNASVVLALNSITNGLAMLLKKARGGTAAEILRVAFGGNQRKAVEAYKEQQMQYVKGYEKTTINYLDIVTSVTQKNTLNIQAEGSIHHTEYMFHETVPNDGRKTAELNNNITRFTNGLIKNVFKDGPQSSVLMLTNAMYLKADWKTFFRKRSEKRTGEFKVENDECKVNGQNPQMKFMDGSVVSTVLTDTKLGAKLLRLPFVEDLDFYAVIPYKQNLTTSQLAHQLTGSKWIEIMNRLDVPQYLTDDNNDYYYENGEIVLKENTVLLPKFTTTTSSSLNDILKNLGIRKMFGNGAEFNYDIPLKVDEIKHQAILTFDEQGAEGAGKTQPTAAFHFFNDFHGTRPFYWLIANSMKDIYYIGLYKGPNCQ